MTKRRDTTWFLIEHDVASSTGIVRGEFADGAEAYQRFFALEKEHLQDLSTHIVLLGSDSLETVKKTHGNLFEPQPLLNEELLGAELCAAIRGTAVPGD